MRFLGAAVVLAFLATPAGAQVVCRTNALGTEVCMGLPAPSMRGREPFTRPAPGLGAVQEPVRPQGGPELTPARRSDALGNTFPEPVVAPPRPRPLPGVAETKQCARDALGNMVCR
jgi:hypothetical protein